MIKSLRLLAFTVIFTGSISGYSQSSVVLSADSLNKKFINWYNLDPVNNKVQGVSVDKAYNELLAGKSPSQKIVVAVIDGGVDFNHADLQDRIWTNKNEIPGNGIDDDGNGYADDIHGWNFLGNAQGENIDHENYEFARLLIKLEPKYRFVEDPGILDENQKKEYELYLRCKEEYDNKLNEMSGMKAMINSIEANLFKIDSILEGYFRTKDFTYDDIMNIKSAPDMVKRAKKFYQYLYKNGLTPSTIEEIKDYTKAKLEYHLDTTYTPRKIINDNTEDINDRNYGNNDVKGSGSEHGTFVAGLIAAKRNNGYGTNGIAENVEIMSVRTVPDGDERDKDVALAIRYAVDNGARIINMSFGKDYSPQKNFVDDAIAYAQDHDVLLVHAAGNDSKNIDIAENYPTRKITDELSINTWIEVGASSINADKELCGSFSNYGKTAVDLFAPGVDVTSLHPENRYDMGDGTSFASPVVAGVAALVWSYYPGLSAVQLKEVILRSTTQYKGKKVDLPVESGKPEKVLFSDLSVTGGIVNAYKALQLAETYTNQ